MNGALVRTGLQSPMTHVYASRTLGSSWYGNPPGLVDEVETVTDAEAFETCRLLAREEGLLAGGSSGVAAAASLRIARRLGPGRTVVTIFPDGAERYPDQGIFA